MIFTVEDVTICLVQRRYPNGRLAIEGLYEDEPYGTVSYGPLTLNLVDEPLDEGDFFVKAYGENKEFADGAMATGIFIDTGRTVKTGYLVVPVWKLKLGVSLPTAYGHGMGKYFIQNLTDRDLRPQAKRGWVQQSTSIASEESKGKYSDRRVSHVKEVKGI